MFRIAYIDAPIEAVPGSTVSVRVGVTNQISASRLAKVKVWVKTGYMDLFAGPNNITYLGDTLPVYEATQFLQRPLSLLENIWVYRAGEWLLYDPLDPIGSTLHELRHGEAIWIRMHYDARWYWLKKPTAIDAEKWVPGYSSDTFTGSFVMPHQDVKLGAAVVDWDGPPDDTRTWDVKVGEVEVGAPQAAFVGAPVVPSSARPGSTVEISAVLRNAGSGDGYLRAPLMPGAPEENLVYDPPSAWVAVGAQRTFKIRFTMPDHDVHNLRVQARSLHDEWWVLDATSAGYIIMAEVEPPPPSPEPEFRNFRVLSYNDTSPPGKITVLVGETVRVAVAAEYRGPAVSGHIFAAYGLERWWGFSTDVNKRSPDIPVSFGPSDDWEPYTLTINVPIGEPAGADFHLYAKIINFPVPDVETPRYRNALDVIVEVGVPPGYERIHRTVYPYAYIYEGDVEMTTATFKTDPFTPVDWAGERFARELEDQARANGLRVIEVEVFADTSPILWTNFAVEITGTPTPQGGGGVAAIPLWLAILIVALGLIGLIVAVTLASEIISGHWRRRPGLHEVKKAWSKETLVLAVQDFEDYWERPRTPVETLEGMSEAELRDILNRIAEEELPPGLPWWAVPAAVGAAGLGIGILITRR